MEWIRLHYLYPDQFDDELIDELAANGKIVKYLDIHFIERGYENFVGKLRSLGADISIVNYPDESEMHEKVISIG